MNENQFLDLGRHTFRLSDAALKAAKAANPEMAKALSRVRKMVETLSSQPGGDLLKDMSPADLRSLLRALVSSQNSQLADEYDYLGEYFEDYYE